MVGLDIYGYSWYSCLDEISQELETKVTFKPMLASAIEDVNQVHFPVYASLKLDGIRATVQGGKLLSRNLKPIPNIQVQKKFAGLPEGLDGELILGNPADKECFSNTTSCVMSDNANASDVHFYVFDKFSSRPYFERLKELVAAVRDNTPYLIFVSQTRVSNVKELLQFEEVALDLGLEGVIVRSLDGPYKEGRSTVNQGWLLKMKRFKDAEAEITGFEEEQSNTNEAKTNALGHTERSSAKAGLVGKGTLGKFKVLGVNGDFANVAFGVGSGLTADQRQKYWNDRNKLVGKIIKYKYFPVGSKDAPRFPIFLGFRDKKDMS